MSGPGSAPKKRSSIGPYIAVVVVIGIVIAAAYFQEPLTAFYTLKLWDRDAAPKVVVGFLEAGSKGDKAAADAFMGTDVYKPLEQNGKWVGYFVVSQAGRMEIPFSDLVPAGGPKPERTEFVTVGKPAAEVFVPDANGRSVKYRLEMQQNGWKITEINGGHPATPPPSGGARRGSPPVFPGATKGGGKGSGRPAPAGGRR
jgi:hypothetical protein